MRKRGGGGFFALVLLIVLIGAGFVFYDYYIRNAAIGAEIYVDAESERVVGFEAHFIDVGQADCELLISGSEAMLIDAGEANTAESVIEYIKALGINELTYVVATHPHADHIGGMAKIIDAFPIKTFLAPDVAHTTKTFENMLDALERNDVEITIAKPLDVYPLGGTDLTVLSPPAKKYDDLNNYSVVIKAEYGDTSFLFTGDAEDVIEEELVSSGYGLDSDVLKIGHHGSNSSTTEKFLEAVSPRYAIISCALENSYGHPHSQTLDRLAKKSVKVYQTSLNGTIIADSDGKTIEIRCEHE